MPVKRRFSSGDADRVNRKMKFSVGKSRVSSGRGVRTLELKYSKADKADRKVKVAIVNTRGSSSDGGGIVKLKNVDKSEQRGRVDVRRSQWSSSGFSSLDSNERRFKKVQSGRYGKDDFSRVDAQERRSKFLSRRKRDFRKKSEDELFAAVNRDYSDGKRKGIQADSGMVEDRSDKRNVTKLDRRSMRAEDDVAGSYLGNRRNALRGKTREPEDSGKKRVSKFKGTELLDRRNIRAKGVGADKLKYVQESGSVNATFGTNDRRRTPSSTKADLNQRKYSDKTVEQPRRIKIQGNKILATDSELTEDPPKKKKRVIRLDPHDTSNKRMDDGEQNNGKSQEHKDTAANSEAEMSKNAQFRAICPSPSILSFVEDNLLGRRREIDFKRAGYNIELPAPLDNIPFSTSSERERIEVPVFRNKLEFYAAAKISSSFPDPDLPEIAFAGRSNVGKSSLLNSLTRQWGVVRTSDKPGLTQTINFFKLGPKLSLVDLPGYGFAYAKEEVKEAWEELVKEYVASRSGLKRVCLLVDTKWGLKPRDHELIDLMERSQTKYQIVLTKTDLVFPIDVARRAMQIEENLKAKKSAVQPLMMVSSKTGAGIRSLRTALANIVKFARR